MFTNQKIFVFCSKCNNLVESEVEVSVASVQTCDCCDTTVEFEVTIVCPVCSEILLEEKP